jgi:hypothetical protein
MEATNTAALRSWVLELGEHAEVLSPPAFREELRTWVEATARLGAGAGR